MALRADKVCPIFGSYGPWPVNVLRTYSDVIKCILHKRDEKKLLSAKDPSAHDITKDLSGEIAEIWTKASIPTISSQQIQNW